MFLLKTDFSSLRQYYLLSNSTKRVCLQQGNSQSVFFSISFFLFGNDLTSFFLCSKTFRVRPFFVSLVACFPFRKLFGCSSSRKTNFSVGLIIPFIFYFYVIFFVQIFPSEQLKQIVLHQNSLNLHTIIKNALHFNDLIQSCPNLYVVLTVLDK